MDESGRLGVAIGRGERGRVSLPVPWPKLTIEDRKSLALAVLRDDVPADHALAAFYLLAAGLDEDAERHLGRAGDAAPGPGGWPRSARSAALAARRSTLQ